MMGITQSTHNQDIYKKTMLTIPDLVLHEDIPTIINWFHYYGIADVKNVHFCQHPEPEYYVENKPFYGYAVIEISEWYKNNGSKNFYESLIAGTAKMVYNDPEYWDVEFYESRTQNEAYPVNAIVQNLQEKFDEVKDNESEENNREKEYYTAESDEKKNQDNAMTVE